MALRPEATHAALPRDERQQIAVQKIAEQFERFQSDAAIALAVLYDGGKDE